MQNGGDFYNGGAGFSPIGNSGDNFTGSYDGQGHTIDGLFIDRSSTNHIGLFGYTNTAEIDNIGVVNVDITGSSRTGVLVGSNYRSTVSNSYSTGSVAGVQGVGGLVGTNYPYSTVRISYSNCDVTGSST